MLRALFIILSKTKRVHKCIILKKPRSFSSPQLNDVFWKGVYDSKKTKTEKQKQNTNG